MSSGNAKRQRHVRDKGKVVLQQNNQQIDNQRPKAHVSPVKPTHEVRHIPQTTVTIVSTEAIVTLPATEFDPEPVQVPVVEPHPVIVEPTIIHVNIPVNRQPQEGFSGEKSVITPMRHGGQRTPTPPSELTAMLDSLREMFVRDRANGSRGDAARCGVCYLTYSQAELTFREDDGLYLCRDCSNALGNQHLPMLRRQRR